MRTIPTSRSFYSASLIVFVSSNLASVLHWIFQSMMARRLGADYGLMNSLFSFSGMLSLPVVLYFTRRAAALSNSAREKEASGLWYALLVAAALICGLVTLLCLPLVPWISEVFKTQDQFVVVLAIVGAAFATLFGLASPLLVGRQWFFLLGAGTLLGAILRLGVGGIGIHYQQPLVGAMVATSIYGGVSLFLGLLKTSWPGWTALPFRELIPTWRDAGATLLIAAATLCISNVDMMVIRAVYSPEASGIFAKVVILARIIVLVIGPLALVVFPKSVSALDDQAAPMDYGIVRHALGMGGAVLFVAAAGLSVLAPFVFKLFLGQADPELITLLRIAVWCLIPLSLCQLVLPVLFARRQNLHLLQFTVLSLLLPVGLVLLSGNLIHAFLVEGVVGLILLCFVAFRLRTKL